MEECRGDAEIESRRCEDGELDLELNLSEST